MRRNLGSLLQDADPILHEASLPDATRERLRTNILRDAMFDRSVRPVRTRRNIAAAVAIAMIGVMALGYGIWVRSTTLLAAVRFEVRLAEETPSQGLIVAQTSESGRMIYLHPEIVVTNDDIAQSWVSQDGPARFGVAIQFSPSGADRMRQATTAHVGRPVAILIDGSVVMAAVVRSPIGDSAVVSGNFTQAEAERIAEGMRLR